MGRQINKLYIGAFIVPYMDNFQEIFSTDEFYDNFCDDIGKFRTSYEGLYSIDVLIPCGNEYAIIDGFDNPEFVIDDFSKLKILEEKLKTDYAEIIQKLRVTYPDCAFKIKSGIVSYYDEIA